MAAFFGDVYRIGVAVILSLQEESLGSALRCKIMPEGWHRGCLWGDIGETLLADVDGMLFRDCSCTQFMADKGILSLPLVLIKILIDFDTIMEAETGLTF